MKKISFLSNYWFRKFDEALGSFRKSAKRAGITAKAVDDAVKNARKRTAP